MQVRIYLTALVAVAVAAFPHESAHPENDVAVLDTELGQAPATTSAAPNADAVPASASPTSDAVPASASPTSDAVPASVATDAAPPGKNANEAVSVQTVAPVVSAPAAPEAPAAAPVAPKAEPATERTPVAPEATLAADDKAEADKAAADKVAADEKKAVEEKAATDKAAADKVAADEKKAVEEKAAADKAAADKVVISPLQLGRVAAGSKVSEEVTKHVDHANMKLMHAETSNSVEDIDDAHSALRTLSDERELDLLNFKHDLELDNHRHKLEIGDANKRKIMDAVTARIEKDTAVEEAKRRRAAVEKSRQATIENQSFVRATKGMEALRKMTKSKESWEETLDKLSRPAAQPA